MAEKSSAGEGGYFASIFGALDPSRSSAGVAKAPQNPSDIPKEELMQLCMKLNKRMQAMEGKAQEYAKKYKQTFEDRSLLIDLIKASLSTEVEIPENDRVDIDFLKDAWLHQLNIDRSHLLAVEGELRTLKKSQVSHTMQQRPDTLCPEDTCGAEGNESEVQRLMRQLETAQMECLAANDVRDENERLQQTLKALRTNYHSLEVSMREKSSRIDHLQSMLESERTRHEEDIVCLRMQQLKADQPEGRAGGGGEEGGIEACRAALAESEAQRALLVSEAAVLGEVKTADAERLEALENELRACREKAREVERNYGASMLLKAEQEALLVTLRRDLMSALAAKEEGQRRVRELEQYRVKAEGQLVRLMEHKERLELTEAKLEESGALVKRLQTQLQAVETNYATKTALLAASEAASEELRSQLSEKEEGLAEVVERMSVLQAQMADAEAKLLQQSTAYAGLEESKQRELADLQASHVAELQREIDQRERSSAEAQAEYAKKSSAARMLLSEREEELRLLRAKVDELKEEIASGNPTERKIFELAKSQADRDAAIELNRDTRELTFQQVQNALAVKDLELARLQQTHTQLANEAADLRRVAKREGVNMDYLKNVVLQYMTFPHASAERNALVPVLSLLLQFSAAELSQVDAASKASIWAPGRQAKEVKLHPIAKEEGAALDQTTARQLHRDLDRSSGRPPHGSGGSQIEPTVYEKPLQYNEV